MEIIEARGVNNRLEFSFFGYDTWDDFDVLGDLLVRECGAEVYRKINGPEGTKIWDFRILGVDLVLLNNPEVGTFLYAEEQANEAVARRIAQRLSALAPK